MRRHRQDRRRRRGSGARADALVGQLALDLGIVEARQPGDRERARTRKVAAPGLAVEAPAVEGRERPDVDDEELRVGEPVHQGVRGGSPVEGRICGLEAHGSVLLVRSGVDGKQKPLPRAGGWCEIIDACANPFLSCTTDPARGRDNTRGAPDRGQGWSSLAQSDSQAPGSQDRAPHAMPFPASRLSCPNQVAVVELAGPQVAGDRDHDAPGDGEQPARRRSRCPTSSPRTVSMIGVNGWCSANQASGPGIDSVGTNPLLRNGRRIRNIGRLLAVSTLFETMPERH